MQSDAIELAMLLTLPATIALAICGIPFVTMIFQGGRFDPADAITTGAVLTALVMGLPAYVLVKVLVPNFYARADTRTPVYAAFAALGVFVALNLVFLQRFGIVGVATASAIGAWLNAAYLYAVLAARGYYRAPGALLMRIARQVIAAAAMGAALWFARDMLAAYYAAGIFARLFALTMLVAGAGAIYFGVAYAIGAVDRERLALLRRKRPAEPAGPSE